MTRNGQRLLMLIDDEPAQRRLVSAIAARREWRSVFAPDGETAIAMLGTQDGMQLDAILLDSFGPESEAEALIKELRARRPQLPILMLTANGSVAQAVAAMRAGATDYLVKPFASERLLSALEAVVAGTDAGELRPLTEKIPALLGFDEIVGASPDFRAALAIAAKAARARVPVLIEGESGVGKEVVAEAIHAASPRGKKPMIAINCGAIPANLVESELFGHEKGAFTGAFERKIGKFADADGGTLFLDEIGEMPLDAQVKLLRVLQSGEVQPIGARHTREVDVRVIAATNSDLARMVADGTFREDLYYRLTVIPITLPPLRERRDDIPLLAKHFLEKFSPGSAIQASQGAMRLLMSYGWPGNVRQLENAIERAVALSAGRREIDVADLPPEIQSVPPMTTTPFVEFPDDGLDLPSYLSRIEQDLISRALERTGGNRNRAAELLRIKRTTLVEKLKRIGQ